MGDVSESTRATHPLTLLVPSTPFFHGSILQDCPPTDAGVCALQHSFSLPFVFNVFCGGVGRTGGRLEEPSSTREMISLQSQYIIITLIVTLRFVISTKHHACCDCMRHDCGQAEL